MWLSPIDRCPQVIVFFHLFYTRITSSVELFFCASRVDGPRHPAQRVFSEIRAQTRSHTHTMRPRIMRLKVGARAREPPKRERRWSRLLFPEIENPTASTPRIFPQLCTSTTFPKVRPRREHYTHTRERAIRQRNEVGSSAQLLYSYHCSRHGSVLF